MEKIMSHLSQALKRPKNYHELSARKQWNIDEKLGLLDWWPTEEEGKEYIKFFDKIDDSDNCKGRV